MEVPIRPRCSLTPDDFTEAAIASSRALQPGRALFVKGALALVDHLMAFGFALGVLFFALAAFTGVGRDGMYVGIYLLLVYAVFLLMFRYRDRIGRALHRADFARKFKSSARLAAPYEWSISEEEIFRSSSEGRQRYHWIDVARVVETRTCFVVMSADKLIDILPARGFASRDDLDRYISLAREKVLQYDVIEPIEYEPGLDEKPNASQEW
ncbi:MAG: hypothetical protein NVSMB14_15360 [Isosphaeraceae bacterium]